MATDLIPPSRREPLVDRERMPERRVSTFLEAVAARIPDQMTNITDITFPTTAAVNGAKINEILAQLLASGLMAAP